MHVFSLKNDPGATLIDSYIIGNLSRFINHASNKSIETFCQRYFFPEGKLAKPNLSIHRGKYGGIELVYLKSTRQIKKHEQLLFSYGSDYWSDDASPFIFLKNNNMLEASIQSNVTGSTSSHGQAKYKQGAEVDAAPGMSAIRKSYSP